MLLTNSRCLLSNSEPPFVVAPQLSSPVCSLGCVHTAPLSLLQVPMGGAQGSPLLPRLNSFVPSRLLFMHFAFYFLNAGGPSLQNKHLPTSLNSSSQHNPPGCPAHSQAPPHCSHSFAPPTLKAPPPAHSQGPYLEHHPRNGALK